MESEVTRREVLSEALKYREDVVKLNSVNGMGLRARPGLEDIFDRFQAECQVLRELMQALEDEEVRAAIAKFTEREEKPERLKRWQIKVLRGEKQAGLFGEIKDEEKRNRENDSCAGK